MSNHRAFTLIELLVVVAIIGILAAVGVVAYNGYTSSAKKATALSNAKSLCKIVKNEMMKASLTGPGTKIFNDTYTYDGKFGTGGSGTGSNKMASAIANGFKESFRSPYGPQPMPNSPSNSTTLGVFVGNGKTDQLNKNFAGINLTTGGNSAQVTINTCTNRDDCSNNIETCVINFSDYGG